MVNQSKQLLLWHFNLLLFIIFCFSFVFFGFVLFIFFFLFLTRLLNSPTQVLTLGIYAKYDPLMYSKQCHYFTPQQTKALTFVLYALCNALQYVHRRILHSHMVVTCSCISPLVSFTGQFSFVQETTLKGQDSKCSYFV